MRRYIIHLQGNKQLHLLDPAFAGVTISTEEPHFLRVNSVTVPKMYQLDNVHEIEDLVALGDKRAADPEILSQVKSRFLNGVGVIDWRQNA